ncbi:hypothetical protein FBU30_000607 [Linnemannia zychae]|nr:hypothetical protein FBU30_000607 [Linnemannia zychae]
MSTTVNAAVNAATNNVTRQRKRKLPVSSPVAIKVEHFRSFFKDPENAEELLNNANFRFTEGSVIGVPSALPEEGDTALISKKKFRGLQFNDNHTNHERIFIAVLYLRDHLRERARPEDINHKFYLSRDGADFRALAEQLEQAQPALRGVTGGALFSLYSNVIEKAKELDTFLKTATGDPWTSTKLADMANELMLLDEEIHERDERKMAEKEGKTAAADLKAKRLTGLAFKTGGHTRKSARTNDTCNTSSTTSAINPSQPIPTTGSSTNGAFVSSSHHVGTTDDSVQPAIPSVGTSTITANQNYKQSFNSNISSDTVITGVESQFGVNRAHAYPPPPPDAASIPNPLRPSSVSSHSLTGKKSISSRSYPGKKSSLYGDMEQDAFKELLNERTTSMMRMVQDMSIEWNQKYTTLSTSVQRIETQLVSMQDTISSMQGTINSILSESQKSKTKHAIFDNLIADVKSTAKHQEEKLISLQTLVHEMAESK